VQPEIRYFKTITNRLSSLYQEFTKETSNPETGIQGTASSESTFMIGSFPVQQKIKSLPSNDEIIKKISLKEKELARKEKVFNIYVEKSNEEGIERLEEEITTLETEIESLKAQLTAFETNSFQLQN